MREQSALNAEIDAAFADVGREGGVSWSESVVIDNYGSMEERLAARASDRDVRWRDLVGDKQWESECGVGGWSFLDPIGFRYYLPASMKQQVIAGHGEGFLEYQLDYRGDEFDSWKAEKHSLLNDRQRACVARFLQFMVDVTREEEWGEIDAEGWQRALDRHWCKYQTKS